MSLAEEANARKARLLALRKRKDGQAGEEEQEDLVLSRRNFDPETRTLRKRNIADDDNEDTVEKDVAGLAEQIIAEDEQRRAEELDLTNIAPKRPNWDLKREMEKKTAKLERKTQQAIHTLIRQRLAAQKGQGEDILQAMKDQEAADQSSGEED